MKTADHRHYQKRVGYTYRFDWRVNNCEDILLMDPVEIGNSWPISGGTRSITAVDHIIDLPIGSYRAIEVTTSYDSGVKTLQYYVPDIGLVAEYTLENGEYTESFEVTLLSTDQGFSQLIRFYYAQPGSDSVRYENRSVNIKPKSSMGSRFVNQFRTVPSGKGLLALDDLSVKSIRLDGKGYVHVDFSSSLTKIVSSVGRATESLILIALTNTFCEYYPRRTGFILPSPAISTNRPTASIWRATTFPRIRAGRRPSAEQVRGYQKAADRSRQLCLSSPFPVGSAVLGLPVPVPSLVFMILKTSSRTRSATARLVRSIP